MTSGGAPAEDVPTNWLQLDGYWSWCEAIAELRRRHLASRGDVEPRAAGDVAALDPRSA
jgi:hypothetical protein